MDTPPIAERQEVVSGLLYRRIPNWEGYFDYEADRPDILTFTPRPQDAGCLSAHLDADEAAVELSLTKHRGFGLCALDIGRIKVETGGVVWVEPAPSARARSHVRVHNCDSIEVQEKLARIAQIARRPERK